MTRRGARVVAAAALLAWLAAALAALPPRLPAGLAAACAPARVLPELLAALAVFALLLAPAFTADEPGRPREDHAGLLAALAAAPAAVALAAAGGRSPASLLAPGAVILACDLAASSYLRLDPRGRRPVAWAAGAAALLAALPVAAWGASDLGGLASAGGAGRLSPLLAARAAVDGGFEAGAPAALLLAGAAAAMRLASALRSPPAAAAEPAPSGDGG